MEISRKIIKENILYSIFICVSVFKVNKQQGIHFQKSVMLGCFSNKNMA